MQPACVVTVSSWLMISWLLPLAPVDIDFQVSFSRGVLFKKCRVFILQIASKSSTAEHTRSQQASGAEGDSQRLRLTPTGWGFS